MSGWWPAVWIGVAFGAIGLLLVALWRTRLHIDDPLTKDAVIMPDWANRLLIVARPLQWGLLLAYVVFAVAGIRPFDRIALAGVGLVIVGMRP